MGILNVRTFVITQLTVTLFTYGGKRLLNDTGTPICVEYLKPRGSYRGADNSFPRPRRKQVRKHVRDARDFNNIWTHIKVFFLQGKASKEIHAILTETLACFIPGRAKDLSAPCIFHCQVGKMLYCLIWYVVCFKLINVAHLIFFCLKTLSVPSSILLMVLWRFLCSLFPCIDWRLAVIGTEGRANCLQCWTQITNWQDLAP